MPGTGRAQSCRMVSLALHSSAWWTWPRRPVFPWKCWSAFSLAELQLPKLRRVERRTSDWRAGFHILHKSIPPSRAQTKEDQNKLVFVVPSTVLALRFNPWAFLCAKVAVVSQCRPHEPGKKKQKALWRKITVVETQYLYMELRSENLQHIATVTSRHTDTADENEYSPEPLRSLPCAVLS